MIDLNALTTGVITQLNTNSTITSLIGGKVVYGVVPEPPSRPYCSMFVITDSANGSYGGKFLDSIVVQFSVYSQDYPEVAQLTKLVGDTLHGSRLTLSSGVSVGCVRRPGVRLTSLRETPVDYVYQGIVTIEMFVST